MHTSIRSLAGSLLAAIGCAATAGSLQAQRFEGILSIHSTSMPPGAGMQYFIKGDRLRLELTVPGESPFVMISDGPTRKQYTLFTLQKVYTTVTFDELLRTTDSLRKMSASLLKAGTMTPTKTVAQVAGHKCTVHRYRDAKSAFDICLSTELGAVSGAPGLFGNVSPSIDPTPPPAWVQKFIAAGSFALRLADTTGKTLWEVQKVEAKKLEASLFAVPAGFTASAAPAKKPSD
ncbi:MAG TPA: DUF4412 domain-containing protein [Gemmatimonadales bacterium]|nr:DUF4412 domain-containing protein [Gemmatimonadales bacterium]